jgi:hypothetical protein
VGLRARALLVVFVRTSGTARLSGATIETLAAHVFALQAGRVTRPAVFLDRREALEAVRLLT